MKQNLFAVITRSIVADPEVRRRGEQEMRVVKSIGTLLVITTLVLSGCNTTQSQMSNKGNEQFNKSISINYRSYDYKHRFVQKATKILALPRRGSLELNFVPSNCVVEVFDAATSDEQELWLYVSIPVHDTPSNFKGWIREAETIPLTKENQRLVQSDISIKAGTAIYEVFEFQKIPATKPTKASYDMRGRLEEKRADYARISCPGGEDLWVKEKFVVYPSIDSIDSKDSIGIVYTNTKYMFNLTFPKQWEDKYYVQEFANTIQIHHKDTWMHTGQGTLFTIWIFDSREKWNSEGKQLQEMIGLQKLAEKDNYVYAYSYPTDVQNISADPKSKDEYRLMEKDVAAIIKTFKKED